MPRKSQGFKKHTIRLQEGDAAIIDQYFPKLGHNAMIRTLVRRFAQSLVDKNEKIYGPTLFTINMADEEDPAE